MPEDKDTSRKQKLIAEAKKRFELCRTAEEELRQAALEDLKFLAGEQWPEHIKKQRELDGRPCLTINQLPVLLRQVTNAQRQNKVSAKVSPFDDVADPDTAEVIQGMIRSIEYNSKAGVAYTTAAFYAGGIGFGFFGLERDYCDAQSFDQDIKVTRCDNPFQWYLDPMAKEPDGSDAKFGFKFCDYTREEFEEEYPDSALASADDWTAAGTQEPGWLDGEGVRVLEYYYIDYQDETLIELENESGETISVLESELKKIPAKFRKKVKITRERETRIPVVKWAKLTSLEVLEETTEPGEYIPMVRVVGDEYNIDGKVVRHGLVRNAKDPQRQSNYMRSAQVEAIALAPKAPWIGAEGQFTDPKWETANVANHAYMEYTPVDVAGEKAPPPQRINTEANISAITQAVREAEQDLHNTTGIFAAQQGAPSNEESGIAINQRKMQGELASYHYIDNVVISIGHGCRIMVQWIPVVYDAARTIRIIGDDESHKVVQINQEFREGGENKTYRLDLGKYDVVCEAGPSWMTKLEEAGDRLTALAQKWPQLATVAGDLIIRALNIPYGNEIAERIKKTLPPQLQDENQEEQPIPPQVQQQMAHMQQMIQQLTAELNKALSPVEAKRMDIQGKLELARVEWEGKLAMAEIETKAQNAMERARWENDLRKDLHMQALDHTQEANMATLTAEHQHIAAGAAADRQAQQQQEQQQQEEPETVTQ